MGRPIYVDTDHPFVFCFYKGPRGWVCIYRAFAAEYRPEDEWTSWSKLLAARGLGSYHVGRAGGGRVLVVPATGRT